jgi:hypothetical protein
MIAYVCADEYRALWTRLTTSRVRRPDIDIVLAEVAADDAEMAVRLEATSCDSRALTR